MQFKQEDTVVISKGHNELKAKEEGENTSEKKTREDLRYPGVRVRDAAVQWEKGNIAHCGHEAKEKSKHTCPSSEGIDKKSQTKKDNEKTLDDKLGARKTHSNQFTETEGSLIYTDAGKKNSEGVLSESKKADLNVERDENNQEQMEEKIVKRLFDKTEEEPTKSEIIDQALLSEEANLNVERSDFSQEQEKKSEEGEESVREFMRRENDETEEELTKRDSVDHGLLTKELDLNVKSIENSQEEEDVKVIKREYDEFGKEPAKSKFIEQHLLANEADPIETNENNQKQERKQEDEEEGVNEVMKSQTDETDEQLSKRDSVDQGLLTKALDLNVKRIENSQEQKWKQKEEDEGGKLIKRKSDESEKEPSKSKSLEQGLLAKEADLNVERDENNQEQEREKEEKCVDEITKSAFDETEVEPKKSEFTDQGLLTKTVELNVEKIKNLQEQRRKEEEEEDDVELMKRENDETGDEPIKYEFIKEGLLAKEADHNVERNENNQKQERKEEGEGMDKIMKSQNDQTEEKTIKSEFTSWSLTKKADLNVERENLIQEQREEQEEVGVDETGEEPIESKFMEQGLLAKEADLNETNQEQDVKTKEEPIKCEFVEQDLLAVKEADVERNGNNQKQEREEKEDEEHDEIIKRLNYKTDEGPIKSEFTDQDLLIKEAYLNVERTENSQEQKREQEEECVVVTLRIENNEAEEEPIKCEFIEQSLLVKAADRGMRNENSQEQRKKPEGKEEGVEGILIRENDESEEEPIKGKFINQDLEQASVCDMGNTAVVPVEKIIGCVDDQDPNEPDVVQQSLNVATELENQATKSQIVDPVNDDLKLKVEMTENAILLQEKEVIEVDSEKTKQEAVGKENDESHEKLQETLKLITDDIIDRNVEAECKLLETAQIESEPSRSEDEDNNLADTVKLQQLGQKKEKDATLKMALNVDLRQFDRAADDHNSSEQPAVVSEQGTEDVITRPETETGNQMETVETTSIFRSEVAAVCVKKSAERETDSYRQPIDTEELAAQEVIGQCIFEQEFLLDKIPDTRVTDFNKLKTPLSEIKLVALEQVDKTAVESADEMPSSSLEQLDVCSSEAQLPVEAKSSFPEQTAVVFETVSEVTEMSRDELKSEQAPPKREIFPVGDTCDKSGPDEEDQINQDECTMQDSATEASSHRLQVKPSEALYVPEKESEQEALEMQKDSQNDTEEQVRIDEAELGVLAEIKDVTSCFGVVDEMRSGLTKESEASEWEWLKEIQASESKKQKNELESQDLVAEMTDMKSMAGVSASGETELVKTMAEPITAEEIDTCQLGFSESEASMETNKECKETVKHEKSLVDSKEEGEDIGRPGLKRGFEKIAGDNDKDKPSELTDPLPPSQVKY